MPNLASLQIGTVVTSGDPQSTAIEDRLWSSAFDKRPVTGPVQVATLGIVGDQVADTVNHGGPDKAILCYAASHYPQWLASHPHLALAPGAWGENMTLTDCDETTVCVGDRYRTQHCEFQISQPRQPCWKISRRWKDKTLTKAVAQSGRTGWYVRVLGCGSLAVGETLVLIDRPHPKWTVARANDVLFGREVDRMAVIELMELPSLATAWKADLA